MEKGELYEVKYNDEFYVVKYVGEGYADNVYWVQIILSSVSSLDIGYIGTINSIHYKIKKL